VSGAVGFWLAADALPVMGAALLDADRLRALARRRLSRLLRTAGRTAFYQARLREAGVTGSSLLLDRDPSAVLAGMAPVGKAELREGGAALFVGGRQRPGWCSSASSGSTGEPFRVYYDARAWATLKLLVKLRARRRCGLEVGHRVALLDVVPPVDASPDGGPTGRVARISVLQPAEVLAAQLVAFAPHAVYGLPSALREAGAVLQGGGARFRVPLIFTSGELLHPGARAAISRAFHGRVFDIYGSSETKEIAWECPAGGMHVNADVVRVEVVDDGGRAVPDGAEGHIVATSLVNHAMPLLRYRVGDRGSLLPGRCECGLAFPLLGVVTGREADVLELKGGRRISPYALTCALERVGQLLRYQVTQLDPVRVRVRAIAHPDTDRAAMTERIRTVLRAEVAPFLEAEVEYVDQLAHGPRAKFRVVEPLGAGARA
jgi:phenylacetate-coenzyme A ligase PaaK-like adenylate-forming protein